MWVRLPATDPVGPKDTFPAGRRIKEHLPLFTRNVFADESAWQWAVRRFRGRYDDSRAPKGLSTKLNNPIEGRLVWNPCPIGQQDPSMLQSCVTSVWWSVVRPCWSLQSDGNHGPDPDPRKPILPKEVKARLANGVFTPLQPVGLREGALVVFTTEATDSGLESWPETLVDLARGYTPGNQG